MSQDVCMTVRLNPATRRKVERLAACDVPCKPAPPAIELRRSVIYAPPGRSTEYVPCRNSPASHGTRESWAGSLAFAACA